jgi:hypothetical protein
MVVVVAANRENAPPWPARGGYDTILVVRESPEPGKEPRRVAVVVVTG